MSKFLFLRVAAVIAAAGMVLAGCSDGSDNGPGANTDPKTLVITGLPVEWEDASAALFWDGDEGSDGVIAGGEAAVTNGQATISLKNFNPQTFELSTDWTGAGNYYVYLWRGNWNTSMERNGPDFYSQNAWPFLTGTPVAVPYTNFEGEDPGEEICRITGTISLTDIPPDVSSISIYAYSYDGTYGWDGSAPVTLSGISGNSGSASWTMPLYENDFDTDNWEEIPGALPVGFSLEVHRNNGPWYRVSLGTVDVDMSDLDTIPEVSLGPASLASITLSGTVNVHNGGSPIRRVYITAFSGGDSLGEVRLDSPAPGTPWSMAIPVQFGGAVSFRVYGADSPDGYAWIFSEEVFPPATGSVSNQNISGIVLDIGDIGGGGSLSAPINLSAQVSGGVVTLTWDSVSGAAAPYRVYRGLSWDGVYAYIGSSTQCFYIDSPPTTGTWYYKVSAVDGGGNESPQSGYAPATISSSLSAPANLSAQVAGNTVTLTWNSVSGAAAPYKVYRHTSQNGTYTYIGNSPSSTQCFYTDSPPTTGTWYYRVSAADGGGNESPQSGYVSATISGGGDTLQEARGRLTLTGFNDFNGKYVYSALVTTSGQSLIGTNAVQIIDNEAVISMVPISGGTAQVPLYTYTSGTNVADMYVPYEGSETFQAVAVMIVNDGDGNFTTADAGSFVTNYAAMISNNPSNSSFTPGTSGGNITISRSEAKTMTEIMAEIGSNPTIMQTVKYLLTLP